MSEYDDLIDMGELVSKLGDNGEIPTDLAAPAAEPVQVIEPETHSFSGGLSDAPMPEQDKTTVDLDELLGLRKPAAAPVEEPRGEPAPESTAPKPGSIEERMAELTARAAKAEADRDRLMTRLIDGESKGAPPPTEESGPELIPETKGFLDPYIESRAREIAEEMVKPLRDDLAPMIQTARDQRLAESIGKFVPGLKAEHMPVLHEAFDSITDPELKAVYGNGLAGAAALAHDLVRRGALDLVKDAPKPRVSPLAARHHTEGGGPRSASGADANDDDAKLKALAALDGRKFLEAFNRSVGLD